MQVVGSSVLEDGIQAVASRSARQNVRDWASRVLKRHLRRDPALVSEVVAGKDNVLIAAMKADDLSSEVQGRILDEWRSGKAKVFVPADRAVLTFFRHAADTMDWIESLPDDDRRIRRIDRMSWKDAEEASALWHEALKKAKFDNNDRMKGVIRFAEFGEGFFLGRLTTKNALQAEGKMMGHCVGGYWKAVNQGKTQIYSLRDPDGYPHVTIELNPTPSVELADGSVVRLGKTPVVGMNHLPLTESNWVATQVRGKQNKKPIDKYLSPVTGWLAENKIPWVEYGQALPDAHHDNMITIWHMARGVYDPHLKGKNFTDPVQALEFGCSQMVRLLEQSQKFLNVYRSIGLQSLLRDADDPELMQQFVERMVPISISVFQKLVKKEAFQTAMNWSGLSFLSSILPKTGLSSSLVYEAVFSAVISKNDGQKSNFGKGQLFSGFDNVNGVNVIVHNLPLAPLSLLANGYATGHEAEVMDMIKPHLLDTITVMNKYPSFVHAIKSDYHGVTSDNIRQAFLYCGLATEYADARSKVIQALKSQISQIRSAIRKARPSDNATVERVNLLRNTLGDGYELRLSSAVASKFGRDCHVVAFEDVKPQITQKLSSDPAVRPIRQSMMRF